MKFQFKAVNLSKPLKKLQFKVMTTKVQRNRDRGIQLTMTVSLRDLMEKKKKKKHKNDIERFNEQVEKKKVMFGRVRDVD